MHQNTVIGIDPAKSLLRLLNWGRGGDVKTPKNLSPDGLGNGFVSA